MIVAIYGYLYVRDARERELDTARLEAELGRARLEELRARLHPHFLFNTLNAISAHVGDDPAGAERMIDRLGALLRRSLAASAGQETTVAEEVETVELYLGIMRDRMGERLDASLDIDDEVLDATLPTLLLQPIVENAIEHGLGPRASGGRVAIRLAREDDRLVAVVEDDGVGLGADPQAALETGFGLSSTVERLRHLYGDRGRLSLEPLPSGTRVRVEIPFVRRPPQAPTPAGDAEIPA